MNKKKIGLLSMALIAGLGLASCSGKPKTNESANMGSVIKTKEDVYAYSMLSSSMLLDNLTPSTAIATLAAQPDEMVKEEEIKKIDNYVKMFDGLLANKGVNQKTEVNNDEDYKEFEKKITLTQSGKSYVSYLNEVAKNEEDKGKEDDEETEIETLLDGIMFEVDENNTPVEDSYYIIDGSKELSKEVEENETEEELEIKFTSYLAQKDLSGKLTKVEGAKTVTVKQEFENETKEDGSVEKEQSFKYIVKDGQGNIIDDECSKVEIEEEKGETEISLRLGNNKENAKIYEFTKKTDKLYVEVFEGKDNKVENIVITFTEDENGNKKHVYEFKDGSKIEELEDEE